MMMEIFQKHEKAEEEYNSAKQCCLYMRSGYNKLYDARVSFVLGQRLKHQTHEEDHWVLHFNNIHESMGISCWLGGLSLSVATI